MDTVTLTPLPGTYRLYVTILARYALATWNKDYGALLCLAELLKDKFADLKIVDDQETVTWEWHQQKGQ